MKFKTLTHVLTTAALFLGCPLLRPSVAVAQVVERPSNPEGYVQTLTTTAKDLFKQRKAVLTPESERLLNQLIAAGARKMAQEPKPDLKAARENMKKFAEEMVRHGRREGEQTVLTEESVTRAKAGLCPLYPIC